jgi:hypothetical protein
MGCDRRSLDVSDARRDRQCSWSDNADGPLEAGLDCQTEWLEDQRMGEGTGEVNFPKWDKRASVGPVGGA